MPMLITVHRQQQIHKMKFQICLLVIALAASSLAVTPQQKEKLNNAITPCREQTGASLELVNKTLQGEFADDAKLKASVLCVLKKIGLANADGTLNAENIRARVKASIDNDKEVERIVALCAVQKSTPEQSGVDAFACLHKNVTGFSPVA